MNEQSTSNALACATRKVDDLIGAMSRGENLDNATIAAELSALRASLRKAATVEHGGAVDTSIMRARDIVSQADLELDAIFDVMHDACANSDFDIHGPTLCTVLTLAKRLHCVSREYRRASLESASRADE